LLRLVALFIPLADRWLWAVLPVAMLTLLFAAGNALRPVTDRTAAEAADRCCLKERTITALEQAEMADRPASQSLPAKSAVPEPPALDSQISEPFPSASEIRELQRQDACRALETLDVRRIRPGSVKKQLLAALACGVLVIVLLLIPNPRDREADARLALRKTLKEGMEEIARAAELDAERLNPESRSELRRLTEDLKRNLENSRDETDALVALDRAERQLEPLQPLDRMENRTAGDVLDAARSSDASKPSDAAESSSFTSESSSDTTESSSSASESSTNTAQSSAASQSAAGASQPSSTSESAATASQSSSATLSTRQALTALKSAVTPASAQAASPSASSGTQGNTSQSGNQSSQGSPAAGNGNGNGNKAANGAGEGSTNLEQGGGNSPNGNGQRGTRDPNYKEAQYETIYDPERTETSVRDEMTNQNRLENGDSLQAEIGPGKGTLGGSVPWSEVLREYEQTETRSAERENLTPTERQWVNDYYSLLTAQQ
ncbi:MAG: hypothetical protein IKE81_01450, partial [Clostridia bacterium]|nr:hypothetical protein [Clostridia bacterium]